jgi:hypothetical protein
VEQLQEVTHASEARARQSRFSYARRRVVRRDFD